MAEETSGAVDTRVLERDQRDDAFPRGHALEPDGPPRVAVILPCYNEAASIARVVAEFRASLPEAAIYVFDNASRDGTNALARAAGAIVRFVAERGKGNVLRQAFAQIEADVYVTADGDGTYDAARAPELVAALWEGRLDMVVGTRQAHAQEAAFRDGHQTGNRLFNWIVQRLFARKFVDIFSGYRVLSRPFVKSFPALAIGFETETEMSVHAIQLGLPCREIATNYGARDAGSASKLKTYRDGARILWFIVRLLKHLRPLYLATVLAGYFAALSIGFGLPVIVEFLQTGLVPRLPTAIAAAALMIIAVLGLMTGLILDGVAYAQQETKRLAYLAVDRRAHVAPTPGGAAIGG